MLIPLILQGKIAKVKDICCKNAINNFQVKYIIVK